MTTPSTRPAKPPSLTELFCTFGKVGLLSFGGPAAQIALMHKELVEDRAWLSEEEFLRGLSFCMLLPGPEAMQLCTYTGWRLHGTFGGLIAGLLFVVPGALVIAALVALYATFGNLPGVQAAFLGVKAAVVIIVLQALRRLSQKALKLKRDWLLAAFGFVGLFLLNLPFPLIVLSAGIVGLAWPTVASEPASLPSKHIPSTPQQSLRTIFFWGGLWIIPLAILHLVGLTFLAELGWFFSKLAVVTFGGAYAVLAYMSQTVVEQHQWITAPQMIDALGLAETTPGPLILVTQFVAMLAGLTHGGPALFFAAGLTALWATFVPCFLWIFAAAPYVERIASHPRLGSALKSVTATVVGVILNLMVWFLIHVLFSDANTIDFLFVSMVWPSFNNLDGTMLLLVLLAPFAALLVRGNMLGLLAVMATSASAISSL